ncbi:MAG TPA: nucleotide exchange factor GrpE [Rhizomicrobium sp.]|jgi:molecular chaperone GrpE|nr:nucleotide exchange factor GrpE [Rhizomicrobium sp.]
MADNDNQTPSEGQDAPAGNGAAADEITSLQAEVAELKERHLRALADAENTRRRAERERLDASQYAVTRFARDMLLVSDNLQRALAHFPAEARADASPAVKAVLEGVEATERALAATLERHGVRAIDTTNAKFDPHLHQAIAEVPAEGRPAGSIVNVVQTGYVIADRLLRPAMVTVARKEDGQAGGAEQASGKES